MFISVHLCASRSNSLITGDEGNIQKDNSTQDKEKFRVAVPFTNQMETIQDKHCCQLTSQCLQCVGYNLRMPTDMTDVT